MFDISIQLSVFILLDFEEAVNQIMIYLTEDLEDCKDMSVTQVTQHMEAYGKEQSIIGYDMYLVIHV